jgi:hypothetical protein
MERGSAECRFGTAKERFDKDGGLKKKAATGSRTGAAQRRVTEQESKRPCGAVLVPIKDSPDDGATLSNGGCKVPHSWRRAVCYIAAPALWG